MSPVYEGSEENKKFFDATPNGAIEFWSTKGKFFEANKEYYIDISPSG
jgi:hypothetical protein